MHESDFAMRPPQTNVPRRDQACQREKKRSVQLWRLGRNKEVTYHGLCLTVRHVREEGVGRKRQKQLLDVMSSLYTG